MNKEDLVVGSLYVVDDPCGTEFRTGDVVAFHYNDGTSSPQFRRITDNQKQWVHVSAVSPQAPKPTLEVGQRVRVVDPVLTGGKYDRHSEGVVLNVDARSSQVQFDNGNTAWIWPTEVVVIASTPLETAKARLAGTQRIYDEASEVLESAQAAFKMADAAHGKAIEEFNKASREFTQADIKNLMVVELAPSLVNKAELRLVVYVNDGYVFLDESGVHKNGATSSTLLAVRNAWSQKTDKTFPVTL